MQFDAFGRLPLGQINEAHDGQGSPAGVAAAGQVGSLSKIVAKTPTGVSASATGIAGDLSVVISGGGTSGDGERNDPPLRRDPRIRTGLEPIAKVHAPPPRPPAPPPIPLPPQWMRPAPAIVPGLDPVEYSDPVATQAMPDIARQILEASRESERIADERDIEDIADMVALLDD